MQVPQHQLVLRHLYITHIVQLTDKVYYNNNYYNNYYYYYYCLHEIKLSLEKSLFVI